MFDFEEAIKLVPKQTVLCVGDLMLDDFVYGEVTRISPEAPTPVLAVARSEVEIGGAGNVARNIVALGARCVFIGLIGQDEAGRTLSEAFAKLDGAVEPHLVIEAGRHTTRKVRFVSEHHSAHLMRADWETAQPMSAKSEAAVIAQAEAILPQVERGGAVGLRQGRAHRAGDPRHHRQGAPARQTRRGRPEGPRLQHLSRRDADHAEPSGTRRRGAPAGHERGRDRESGGRSGETGRERCRAGHTKRRGHVAAYRWRRAGRHSGLCRSRCATCPAPAIRSRR